MESTAFIFALVGVSMGLLGFTMASANIAKIKKLEEKIAKLTGETKEK